MSDIKKPAKATNQVSEDKKKSDALDIARMDGEGAANGASFQKKETSSKA